MNLKNKLNKPVFSGLAICFILFAAVGCGLGTARAPHEFPDADIVFAMEDKLGFINADGTDLVLVPFKPATSAIASDWWAFPLITGDNQYLIYINGGFAMNVGDVYIAQAGKQPVYCSQWGVGSIQLTANQTHVLFNAFGSEHKIVEYEPEACAIGALPITTYDGVTGVLSPEGSYIAGIIRDSFPTQYHYKKHIVIRQINTQYERVLGEGDWPAWSRNGQWLAYTGPDGIYVIQVSDENSVPYRVVGLKNPNTSYPDQPLYDPNLSTDWTYSPPMVSWSPDGQWLVYHMLGDNLGKLAGYLPSNYSIYKVNIFTSEVLRLTEGGITPFWRWPAQP